MSRKTPTSSMRDSQTDTRGKGEVVNMMKDLQAGTIQEQSIMRGDNINKPVGDVKKPNTRFDSVGGRGSADSIAAKKLGAESRKK